MPILLQGAQRPGYTHRLPPSIAALLSKRIPFSARDSTAWNFAVACRREQLPRSQAEELALRLHANTAQPPAAEDE